MTLVAQGSAYSGALLLLDRYTTKEVTTESGTLIDNINELRIIADRRTNKRKRDMNMNTDVAFQAALSSYDSTFSKRKTREAQPAVSLAEAAGLARTFDDWLDIFFRSQTHTKMERRALWKLARLPVTEQKLTDTLDTNSIDGRLKTLLERRLERLRQKI